MALLLLWEGNLSRGSMGHNLKSDPVLEQAAESLGLPRAEQSPSSAAHSQLPPSLASLPHSPTSAPEPASSPSLRLSAKRGRDEGGCILVKHLCLQFHFIYSFLAVLGLRCCKDLSLLAVSMGYSLVVVHRLPIAMASLVENRL